MEANLFTLALIGAAVLATVGLGLLLFNPSWRRTAVISGASGFALVSCSGCANVNDARDAIGLQPLPDLAAACQTLEATAERDFRVLQVLSANDEVICEVYASIEGYIVLQEAVIALNDRALASTDPRLEDLALFVSGIEQRTTPAVANANRALDLWLYFDSKVDDFATLGNDYGAVILEAGRTYAELQEIWRDTEPRIQELKVALGMN